MLLYLDALYYLLVISIMAIIYEFLKNKMETILDKIIIASQ